ncbi:MAG: DNA topology modulation protein [Oscillospiraceae bacterium]|nr:DNA topology modulation protein [Oscillospiraceae bacterium]
MKIAIVGYSGAGKSTTARMIGEKYGIPVLFLDTVYHMAGWQVRPNEECIQIVSDFMAKNHSWVIDGNYKSILQAERFEQADRILFFNIDRFTCFRQAFGRYLKYRGKSRPDMTEGCNEKFDLEFARWILKDGRTPQKVQGYKNMCQKYADKVVVISNQKDLENFFKIF